jgi:hypothetical protein
MSGFFVEVDPYGEETLWDRDGGSPFGPTHVIQKCDLPVEYRDELWRRLTEPTTGHEPKVRGLGYGAFVLECVCGWHQDDGPTFMEHLTIMRAEATS